MQRSIIVENPVLTRSRKKEHLSFFQDGDVSFRQQTTWLEHVHLFHNALPEIDSGAVDLSVEFAGHRFKTPLFVTGITGGTQEATRINRALAGAAEEAGIGFGLGSMRAAIEDPALIETYMVRDVAPSIFLAGNIGGAQLGSYSPDRLGNLLEKLGADALCVHLNPAQEMTQPEGDRDFRGIIISLATLIREIGMPVIVKETGAGFSREVGLRLRDTGVKYVDVAGAGGTSWVGVELLRSGSEGDREMASFWDWGIPTAASVAELSDLGFELIASGGIRSGLDAARSIALGARLSGFAAPVLKAYFKGGESGCLDFINSLIRGLKIAMVLTGSRSLVELRSAPRVITGPLYEWMNARRTL